MKNIKEEIKKRKKKGFNRAEIIPALLKLGYSKEEIKEALPKHNKLFYFFITLCSILSIAIFMFFILTRSDKIFSIVGIFLLLATILMVKGKKLGKYIWIFSVLLLSIGFLIASIKSGLTPFSLVILIFPIVFIYGLNISTKSIDHEFTLDAPKNQSDLESETADILNAGKCPACLSTISEIDNECPDCGLVLK